MRGKFISFEGGEGGGKSTQAAFGRFSTRRRVVVETRELGGTKQGEELRDLQQGDPDRWSPFSELLLMTAACGAANRVIEPALEAGTWVICDRFFDSTMAYQGIAGELGVDFVRPLQNAAIGDAVPDVTFLLDLREEAGLQRAEKTRRCSAF